MEYQEMLPLSGRLDREAERRPIVQARDSEVFASSGM